MRVRHTTHRLALDLDLVPAVASFSNGEASMSAVGRHHNRRAPGPVKLPGMALGLTRRTRAHPVDLENLAYAAYEFREALIPLQGIIPDRCDGAATELRNRALVAEERFFAAAAGLPRRERTLAGHWENAAVMRYRHGLEVFARAEDLGADMLAQLATHRRPSLPALTELCDVCTHARTLDQHQRPEMFGAIPRRATRFLRTATADSAGADHGMATGRSCIVDQAELRWRIRRDLTSLLVENALAGDGITREAERHLVPWLKLACETLDSPMSIDGLEDVAAQWRERRRPYMLAAADRADVIIVDPIPRQRATLWWKLVHGDEPPPPL